MNHPTVSYQSRQFLKLLWLFLPLFTMAMVIFDMRGQSINLLPRALATVFVVNIIILSMFGYLEISLEGEDLKWRFGLLGWPNWSVKLCEIKHIEVCQTQWYEGKGIRFTREGMLYNAAGRGAVRIIKNDGTSLRLGSPEPEILCRKIIESKAAQLH